MRLQTILNQVEIIKPFVYSHATFKRSDKSIIVHLRARKGSKPVCSNCGCRGVLYDRLPARLVEYIPIWGLVVYFSYRMRRVNCRKCGVTVERVPWCEGKHQLTTSYQWFLSRWAKKLSWQEVARTFRTSWSSVMQAVEAAVEWGLAHRELTGIKVLGIDEIAWKTGHKYFTLVYDITGSVKRLVAIAQARDEASLRESLDSLGSKVCEQVEYVCSDMWRPYLKVIKEQLSKAVHILDRFHIMQKFNKALDEIRASEQRELKREGYEPVLTKSRWLLLKQPRNLTSGQTLKLGELLKYNLKSVRAYLLREEFQQFWQYESGYWAEKFLNSWITKTLRSRLSPMKEVASMLRSHQGLILNWFKAKGSISQGAVEGLNNKVKVVTRKSYGFRTERIARLALWHNLGHLPEPPDTHKFL
jgi:transposase